MKQKALTAHIPAYFSSSVRSNYQGSRCVVKDESKSRGLSLIKRGLAKAVEHSSLEGSQSAGMILQIR
jgi:hypothetical protein